MAFKIGNTEFATLDLAIDAAVAGDKIVALDDENFGDFTGTAVTIPTGKSLTLDLAGHTIEGTATNAGNSRLISIAPGAEVTIDDSVGGGKISYSGVGDPAYGYGTYTVENNGKLTVKNGTIENLTNGGASYAIENHDNYNSEPVTLDILGGVIDCPNGDQGIRMYCNDPSDVGESYIRVSGGVINNGIWMNDQLVSAGKSSNMELGIFGGEVNGLLDLTNPEGKAVVNIAGGDLKVDVRVRKNGGEEPFINITDGKVEIGSLNVQDPTSSAKESLLVKGGTLDAATATLLSDCLDEGIEFIVNPDGTVSADSGDHKWVSKRNLKYAWKRIKDRLEIVHGDAVKITSEGHLLEGGHRLDVLFDDETIVLDSEGNLSVPIDNLTIIVNSEGLLQATGVEEGIATELIDSEGSGVKKINVRVDNLTVVVNSENDLEVPIDNKTLIIGSEGLLVVNIDNDTIVLDSEGRLSSGSVFPDEFTIVKDDNKVIRIPLDFDTIEVDSEGFVVSPRAFLNGVELKDDKNTEEVRVTWFGTQDEYDALPEHYPYTLYVIDDSEGYTPIRKSYLDLADKPKINHVELGVDMSLSSLGIQPAMTNGDAIEIVDDRIGLRYHAGVLTLNSSNELTANTYTFDQIDNLISSMRTIKFVEDIVIPPSMITPNTLFYVNSGTPGLYNVYLYDYKKEEHSLGTSQIGTYFAGAGINIDTFNVISVKKATNIATEHDDPLATDKFTTPATVYNFVMRGATSAANGDRGVVPAPVKGDQYKLLRGDASWTSIRTDDELMSSTQPYNTFSDVEPVSTRFGKHLLDMFREFVDKVNERLGLQSGEFDTEYTVTTNASGKIRVQKFNRVIYITFDNIRPNQISSAADIFTLPVGCRPKVKPLTLVLAETATKNGVTAAVKIDTDGTVRLFAGYGINNYSGHISFPV